MPSEKTKGRGFDRDLPKKMYTYFLHFDDASGAPSFGKFAASVGLLPEDIEKFREKTKFDCAYRACNEIRRDYLIDSALSALSSAVSSTSDTVSALSSTQSVFAASLSLLDTRLSALESGGASGGFQGFDCQTPADRHGACPSVLECGFVTEKELHDSLIFDAGNAASRISD